MTLMQRINAGCSLINIIIYPIIMVYIWYFPLHDFYKLIIDLIGLFFIIVGIEELQTTPYKVKNSENIIK